MSSVEKNPQQIAAFDFLYVSWKRHGALFVDKKSLVINVDFLSTNEADKLHNSWLKKKSKNKSFPILFNNAAA